MSGRDSSHAMGSMASPPALGASSSGVRFELVRADADETWPFVVLHHGRLAHTFLAELRVEGLPGDAEPLRRFALKVQNDRRPLQARGSLRALTNLDIDALWQREVDDLAAAASPHVARPVPVPAGLTASRPVTWCAKTDRYFHPVCAETGQLLTVCKDDSLLARNGLIEYSVDTWRYLHAEAAPAARTFYRLPGTNGERPREGVLVRLGAELFRDWGRLVHAEGGDQAAQAAAAALPCLRCEHRGACYPPADGPGAESRARVPAEDHLHAVSFYDLRAQALELQDIDFDQLCDLLGGGDPTDVLFGAPMSRGQQRWLQRSAQRLLTAKPAAQWLFATDPQRFPREVLWAKLTAFQQVCEGLQALHRQSGRPHFGLCPGDIRARLSPAGQAAPARWPCDVQLVGLGGAMSVVVPGLEGCAPALFEPEPGLREDLRRRPYASPELLELDGQSCSMAVQFRAGTLHDGKLRLLLEASGSAPLQRYRAGDFVLVTLAAELPTGDCGLWTRISELRRNGLLASAEIDEASPWARWAGSVQQATCMFFRTLGPPIDLYGLGMLLFRAVLGNDDQGIAVLQEAVSRCVRPLRSEFCTGVSDGRVVARHVDQLLLSGALRSTFAAWNVLQRRGDRLEYQRVCQETPPIETKLWRAVLEIGFKLVSQVRGYSYGDGQADGSPFLLRQVQEDLEVLRRHLHVDMFAADLRATRIVDVCSEVRDALRAELALPANGSEGMAGMVPAPASGPGCHLSVKKDGEAPRELDFTCDKITLGRREAENIVHLGDPMVSGLHATIELEDGAYVILDRNSTNGTEVDGIRLPGEVAMPLQDGSSVRIRPFTITFRTSLAAAVTTIAPNLDSRSLLAQLHDEFVARFGSPLADQREALRLVLRRAREVLDGRALLARVEEVIDLVRADGRAGET